MLITLLKAYKDIQNFKTLKFTNWKLLIKKCLRLNTSKDLILGSVTTRLANHLRGRAKGESFSIFYNPFTD